MISGNKTPIYEKSLSTFVELGGGVRCLPSTFSKWVHHGLVGGLPAMVVVGRMCFLSSDSHSLDNTN